jgi:hypothetical protein
MLASPDRWLRQDLELAAAPRRASRSIVMVGGCRNRRQGVTSPVAGDKAVIADTLIAGPALDLNVIAERN